MARFYSCFLAFACCFLTAGLAKGQSAMGPWSNTGPVAFPTNVSGQIHGIGRVSQLKFHPTNASKIYAVSASGGVYLTSDTGLNWAPLSGTEKLPQTSTSSLCINYANDKTLYLCLGDADYYSNDYGIYKSTNGGTSWAASNTGIGTNMAVEILMDPTDTSKLVAATKGGLYRSTNAGGNWTLMQAGAFTDMKAKPVPGGSQTLYAATATAFYYSTNFGATWTAVTIALPAGNTGIRIAVSANDTGRVYLATTKGFGVILKSINSGVSFAQVYNSTQCLVCYDAGPTSGGQGNYNIDLNANPTNADELLIIAHCVWRSTNGGVTWSKRTNWFANLHTDMHHIEWNPHNNSQIWTANDGGVWMTTDPLASNWNPRSDGLAASEMYHAAQSPTVRDLVSVGTQDNGELYYTAGAWKTNRGGDWTTPCAIDYRGNGTVWYLAKGNRRNLLPLGSDQSFNVPYNPNPGTFVQSDRAKIDFPKGLPAVAFLGRDSIYRCSNTNASTPAWQRILTTAEEVQAIESCAADSNILYVATKSNHLFRSDNALDPVPVFTQLNSPAGTSIAASVTTSAANAQVVFMSCGSTIYRSVNKGVTWTNITGTGLSGINIRKIIHDDFSTTQRLFVNAGAYIHYKDSNTTVWSNHSAGAGLPTVADATDFMIYNDGGASSLLRLSTYGRGVWECDIRANLPPTADFVADKTVACPGDTIRFSHAVGGSFTSLSWSFPGGNPATSTALNPVVIYAAAGIYPVTLTATGSNGTNTITKTAYIIITLGQTAQVAEGFEGTAYPPAGWRLQNTSGTDWTRTNAASGFGASTNSISWNNFSVNAGGLRDAILTPKVDLAGLTNARLKFDVAYAPYGAAYPDSLQVRVSTNCGATWTVLYSKTGTTLATAPTYIAGAFVPTATQWRTDSVSLLPYTGQSILLSFDNIGRYGQQLFLDNINVLLSPKAKFGSAGSSLCSNVPVTFTDSSTNVISRAWTFTGGTPSSSTVQNPVVTYSTVGSYTARLIVTNGLGSDTLSKIVVVSNGFVVNLGNDTSVCPGSSVTLNAGTGGSSYLFSNGATTQTTTVTTAGTYSVTVTRANGCTVRDTLVITAAPAPIVNLGPDASVCSNSTLTLNAGNTGSSYLWSTGATTQSVTASTAGTYSVRVTSATGCIGRDTLVVSATTAPTVSLGPDITLCLGSSATLNAGNTGSSYLWSTGATTQSVTAGTAGTYSVRVTNAAGCIGRDTIVITTGNPVVNLGADATICSGNSVTLNAGNAGSSFLWSTGATSQSVLATTAGTYSVRVTNAAGCIARDTIVITTGTSPLVNLGPDAAICPGTFSTLNAGNAGSSFLWSNGATTQSTSVSVGTYNVRVTNAAGCIARDTIVISALPAPLVNLGPDAVLCPGTPLTLDAGLGGNSYLWSNGATTQTTVVSTAGTYSVTVTGANGCMSKDTIIVTPGTLPTGTITAAGSLLMAGSTGVTYQWFRNGVAIAGAVNASYTATQSGSYTVLVTNAQGCVGISPAFQYVSIGVTTALQDAGYDLFPNPTTGLFTITGKGIGAAEVSVRCYNAAGAFVREERLPVSGGILNAALNWGNLARGSYNVVIKAGMAEGIQMKVVIR